MDATAAADVLLMIYKFSEQKQHNYDISIHWLTILPGKIVCVVSLLKMNAYMAHCCP